MYNFLLDLPKLPSSLKHGRKLRATFALKSHLSAAWALGCLDLHLSGKTILSVSVLLLGAKNNFKICWYTLSRTLTYTSHFYKAVRVPVSELSSC